jgi:hypothetical protein
LRQSWWVRFKMSDAHTQVSIVCTILIMLATIAYAIIAGCQLAAMNGQLEVLRGTLEETRRSGKQSTDQMWAAVGNINWMARSMDWSQKEAQNGIEANERQSRQSLQATIDDFQRDQRPWVVVKSIDFGIPIEKGTPFMKLLTIITNSGRSPAFDIRITNGGFKTSYGPLDVDNYARRLNNNPSTSVVLATGDTAPLPFEVVPITEPQANDIRNRVLWVYAFGDIHYKDFFGIDHLTEYCGVYDPPTNRFDNCKSHVYIDRNK